MAIKAGAILHDVNGYVVDRIQTAGPGNLNIPEEKIYELGNWQTVATVRDVPDLSFDLESFDVSTEFECILTNKNPTTFSSTIGANEIDLQSHVPIDVISPFKSARNQYDIVKGVAVPYLTLERATYRYGLRQNATQQFTLRGDSIFYCPGQPYYEEFTWAGMTDNGNGTFSKTVTHTPMLEYAAESTYVLAICLVSTNGQYRRLFAGDDYTSNTTSFTVTAAGAAKVTALGGTVTLRVVYSSSTLGSYTQSGNNPRGNAVHQGVGVKPAAVRPKNIDVYIGSTAATPVWTRFNSVQSAEVNWSVSIENDEEFGNSRYVSSDYDVPDVSGSIGVKPFDVNDLFAKIQQITGITDSAEVVGPSISATVPLEIRISDPNSPTTRLKTLYIPDARFQVPGMQGRVQTKMENTFSFTSDSGTLKVYNGKRVA